MTRGGEVTSVEGGVAETTHLHAWCSTSKKRVQVSYDGGELPLCPVCGTCALEDLSIHPAHATPGVRWVQRSVGEVYS